MNQPIHTERLTLRPLQIEDASFILTLFNSESWLRHIGDRGVHTLADAESFLQNNALRHFETHGWGTYLITDTMTGASMGTIGLYEREHLEHPDFGYALLPEYEGQGYVTEASLAYIQLLRDMLDLSILLAIVKADNPKSIRVLEKLGFIQEKEIELDNVALLLWRILL